ncbi:hypothetical protein HMPREF9996_01121 [Aggregatibacter actinomycetemcomitans Y4]|nr:hypothetical protein HMPREF9996_01121 [Aggregatibacter actinomycetemcomitans Y4]
MRDLLYTAVGFTAVTEFTGSEGCVGALEFEEQPARKSAVEIPDIFKMQFNFIILFS